MACTADGSQSLVYFVTGRSDGSRNRRFVTLENGDVAVQDTRTAAEFDPLRHYVAVARRDDWCVVGNGNQVAPFAQALAAGAEPLRAWSMYEYEPDAPIFTPRIWGQRTVRKASVQH